MLETCLDKEKISHAFIFETNGYSDALLFAKSFAKDLFCSKITKEDNDISNLIDLNNFPDLIIVDETTIKKENIMNIQDKFSKKPIYADKQIYIINNANKMNESSYNSLLKFLEEPFPHVYAILLVNNRSELSETINSRCQIVTLLNDDYKIRDLIKKIAINNGYESDIGDIEFFVQDTFDLFDSLNNSGDFSVLYIQKKYLEIYLNCLLYLFIDLLNYNVSKSIKFYNDYNEKIQERSNCFQLKSLIEKIDVLISIINEYTDINGVNKDLLIDRLIIKMQRGDNSETDRS